MVAYYAYPPKSSFRYGRLDKVFYKKYKLLLLLVNVRKISDLRFHEPDASTHINAISNIILAFERNDVACTLPLPWSIR